MTESKRHLLLEQAYQIENEVSALVMQPKDAREGPRAFKEKRKPSFTGERESLGNGGDGVMSDLGREMH